MATSKIWMRPLSRLACAEAGLIPIFTRPGEQNRREICRVAVSLPWLVERRSWAVIRRHNFAIQMPTCAMPQDRHDDREADKEWQGTNHQRQQR